MLTRQPDPAPLSAHRWHHLCDHPGCERFGAWGYGVRLQKGQRGRWYCAEHRPVEPREKPSVPADPGPLFGVRGR